VPGSSPGTVRIGNPGVETTSSYPNDRALSRIKFLNYKPRRAQPGPPPPCGGVGVGVAPRRSRLSEDLRHHPHPRPSPQGGGEKTPHKKLYGSTSTCSASESFGFTSFFPSRPSWSPSPLWGGVGVGVAPRRSRLSEDLPHHPHPRPSPQGGGEKTPHKKLYGSTSTCSASEPFGFTSFSHSRRNACTFTSRFAFTRNRQR